MSTCGDILGEQIREADKQRCLLLVDADFDPAELTKERITGIVQDALSWHDDPFEADAQHATGARPYSGRHGIAMRG